MPALGLRASVTYIPSKRDRQFLFDNTATNSLTANILRSFITESSVPVDTLRDVYIDFEVFRWSLYSESTEWSSKIS